MPELAGWLFTTHYYMHALMMRKLAEATSVFSHCACVKQSMHCMRQGGKAGHTVHVYVGVGGLMEAVFPLEVSLQDEHINLP